MLDDVILRDVKETAQEVRRQIVDFADGVRGDLGWDANLVALVDSLVDTQDDLLDDLNRGNLEGALAMAVHLAEDQLPELRGKLGQAMQLGREFDNLGSMIKFQYNQLKKYERQREACVECGDERMFPRKGASRQAARQNWYIVETENGRQIGDLYEYNRWSPKEDKGTLIPDLVGKAIEDEGLIAQEFFDRKMKREELRGKPLVKIKYKFLSESLDGERLLVRQEGNVPTRAVGFAEVYAQDVEDPDDLIPPDRELWEKAKKSRRKDALSEREIEELFAVVETRLESADEHLQEYLSYDEIFDRKAAEDVAGKIREANRQVQKTYRRWEPPALDEYDKDDLQLVRDILERADDSFEYLYENTLAMTGNKTLARPVTVAYEEFEEGFQAVESLLKGRGFASRTVEGSDIPRYIEDTLKEAFRYVEERDDLFSFDQYDKFKQIMEESDLL